MQYRKEVEPSNDATVDDDVFGLIRYDQNGVIISDVYVMLCFRNELFDMIFCSRSDAIQVCAIFAVLCLFWKLSILFTFKG